MPCAEEVQNAFVSQLRCHMRLHASALYKVQGAITIVHIFCPFRNDTVAEWSNCSEECMLRFVASILPFTTKGSTWYWRKNVRHEDGDEKMGGTVENPMGYDMIWYMIWYDMIWYDMIWYDTIRYDMIWYDMIWYDMIWYDMIWYDMIWYDMIWYDMIWYDMI